MFEAYLTALLRKDREYKREYWLGLWAPNGVFSNGWTFFYEDNSEFNYANWVGNYPTTTYMDNCVVISGDSKNPGKWKNTNCNTRKNFVCSVYASKK